MEQHTMPGGTATATANTMEPATHAIVAALVIAGYFLAALTGVALTRTADNIATLWPANALFLIALLRTPATCRQQIWPIYFCGCPLANLLVNLWFGDSLWIATGLVACNLLEVLAGAALLTRWWKHPVPTKLPLQKQLTGAALTGLLAPILGATAGTALMYFAYRADPATLWPRWWFADAIGMLIIAPLAASLTRTTIKSLLQSSCLGELLTLFVLTITLTVFSFTQSSLWFLVLILPIPLWAALRLGVLACAVTSTTIALLAIALTLQNYGPLALIAMQLAGMTGEWPALLTADMTAQTVLWLQLFLVITVLPAILVAAVLHERNQHLTTLHAQAERLQALYQTMPAMLHSIDAQGRLIAVSDHWLEIMGYSRAQVIGRRSTDFLTEDSRRKAIEILLPEFMRSGICHNVNYQMVKRDGAIIDVLLSATAERSPDGKIIRSLAIIHDITARLKAEQALQASEQRFMDFAAAGSDWLWETDPEGRYRWFSDNVELSTNLPAAWHYGKRRLDLLCIADPELAAAHQADIIARRPFKDVIVYRDSPGGRRWFRSSGVPAFDETGAFLGYRGIGTDITELRNAEQRARAAETRLAEAIEGVQEAFALYDANARLVTCNTYYKTLHAAVQTMIIPGMLFEDFLRAQLDAGLILEARGRETQWLAARLAKFRQPGEPFELERTNGCWILIRERRLADGSVLAVGMDISERKAAEKALFAEKERAQVTLKSIGDAVITTDADGTIDYLNPIAETLTGWPLAAARGRPSTEVFRIISERTRSSAPDPVARCLSEGQIVGLANQTILLNRHGDEYAIEDSVAPIRDARNQILGAVLVFHDVSEQRQLQREITHQATHDALTGLINRREFEYRLRNALQRAHAQHEQHILCYLDLDNFKIVNDTAGHIAGDALLKQIAHVINQCIRKHDTLARLGGDEFGIILEDCPLDSALELAGKIVKAVHDFPFFWQDQIHNVGLSVGLTVISEATESLEVALSQADVACYSAKGQGRNCVVAYQSEDNDSTHRHCEMQLITTLQQALENEQFRLYGQPICKLGSGQEKPVFYELLLRLTDTNGSLIMPGTFIPAAERYQLMPRIDRWVIQHALQHYTALFNRSVGIGMTLNLSGHSLGDNSFLAFVHEQLNTTQVPPEHICFEITETAAINNLGQATQFVNALRQRGCRIALDDFGSGFCSVNYLKLFPVDYLKIDGSFVRTLLDNPIDRAVVESINTIGHLMGTLTIAEYVENTQIAKQLEVIGVDLVQGFGVGRPEPLEQLMQAHTTGANPH